jgi:hypothetical protein
VEEPSRTTPRPSTEDAPSLVDWSRTARRMRLVLGVLGVLVLLGWIVLGVTGDGIRLRTLGELFGFALLAAFVVEFVVVGGAALRGLLQAGARGERLAGDDVSLVPPQLARRRRRD